MKRGSILIESAVILALAVAVGTAVHLCRPAHLKIKFIESYPGALELASKETQSSTQAKVDPAVQSEGVKSVLRKLQEPPVQAVEPPAPVKAGFPEILVDEARRLFQDDATFIDARRPRYYNEGHIARARSFPVWEADIDLKISNLLSELPQDQPVVIYCSGGDCEDSHMLANKLKLAGYTNLLIFKEGYPKWVEKNLPVEKGEKDGQAPGGPGEEK